MFFIALSNHMWSPCEQSATVHYFKSSQVK